MNTHEPPDGWVERFHAIQNRVAAAVTGECEVTYSVYGDDANGLPVDNLDEVAVRGRVQFVDDFGLWHSGEPYVSPIVSNPTWLEVAVLANEMIKVTGDYHHIFLEGITVRHTDGDVKIMEFSMGS